MTTNINLRGNTIQCEAVEATDGISAMTVGSAITSAGGNITITASNTVAQALQEIADIADPEV